MVSGSVDDPGVPDVDDPLRRVAEAAVDVPVDEVAGPVAIDHRSEGLEAPMAQVLRVAGLPGCRVSQDDVEANTLPPQRAQQGAYLPEEAAHLGINTERAKRALFVLASILTGCAVSVGGIIGFVGLIIPHLMRIFIGSDHRILLVGSFLGGACFLIFCDTLARIIVAPSELPVGVITGILGGSFFIYALTKKGKSVV